MKLRIHRHKWEFLGKDFHVKTKTNFRLGYASLGSSSQKEEINITTIRFFCRKCASMKSETVEGKVTTKEIMQVQGFDLNRTEQ